MNNQITKNQKEHNFIKEIAKYFMDFLETDFHKRRLPRRSVKYKNNDNLLIGINLTKYPKFIKQVSNIFNSLLYLRRRRLYIWLRHRMRNIAIYYHTIWVLLLLLNHLLSMDYLDR